MNLFRKRRSAVLAEQVSAAPTLPRDNAESFLMPQSQPSSPVFVRGQGSWMWDAQGRVFLDFHQGGAVNCLGHSPAVLIQALNAQAQTLINPGADHLHHGVQEIATRLCRATGSDQAYFLDSGTEACESAIKLARKWGQRYRGGACGIITATRSCHGHSLGTLSVSGQPALADLFEPKVPGFTNVAFNDLAALHAAVDARTVAIMLEPIQSHAGMIPATHEYLQGVEKLCRELGILLILDEVQTGLGRCGALLCEETYGVRADIIALGKGLGGGVPLAALLARGKACCAEPGEHGNPLMIAAGLAVLHSLQEPQFLHQVRESGEHMREGLSRIARRYGHGEVRGQGLLWGMSLSSDSAAAVVAAAQAEGLLINAPQPDCLRFSPALTVSQANIEEMLLRLARAFARVKTALAQTV